MIKLLASIYAAYNQATIGEPWYPANGATFCNMAVNFVCNAFGYLKFNAGSVNTPIMANAMVSFMGTSSDWMSIDGAVAQAHANVGALVIAGQVNPDGHGHVCVVIPGEMQPSAHYAKDVPVVMNVGKDVFIGKPVSFSFQTEPTYFVLVSTIPKQGT
jgi:hypothetical protein